MPMIDDTDDDLIQDDDFSEDDFEVDDDTEATVEAETEEEESETPEKPEEPEKSETKAKAEDKEESYGKRVQKRIDKLVKEKRELENAVRQMQSKVETIEAKHTAREFSDFQQQVNYSEYQVKSQYEAARGEYKKAVEEGDIDAQLTAQDKMLELRDQLTEKRRLSELAKEQAEKFQQATPQPKPEQQTAQQIPDNLPDGTQRWLKQNRWYVDGSDLKAAAYARQLDADLQEEGFSPDDPAMYVELDRRLHTAVPRLAKKSPVDPKPVVSPPRQAPKSKVVGSSADGQSSVQPKTPSRKLTSGDLETMRKYGFDPHNSTHRKAWIKRNDPL